MTPHNQKIVDAESAKLPRYGEGVMWVVSYNHSLDYHQIQRHDEFWLGRVGKDNLPEDTLFVPLARALGYLVGSLEDPYKVTHLPIDVKTDPRYPKSFRWNGYYYKNQDAFKHQKGVCYIPEESEQQYTYQDLIRLMENDPEAARKLFDLLKWQQPEIFLEKPKGIVGLNFLGPLSQGSQ